MDIGRCLRGLQDVESRLEALYDWYGEIFAEDEEAAAFFRRLAREERSHAELVAFQKRLALKDRTGFSDVDLHWDTITALLAQIDELVGSDPPPRLNEAIASALLFESSGAELYMPEILARSNPGLEGLVRKLGQANREHFRRLQEFAEARKILVWMEDAPADDDPSLNLSRT